MHLSVIVVDAASDPTSRELKVNNVTAHGSRLPVSVTILPTYDITTRHTTSLGTYRYVGNVVTFEERPRISPPPEADSGERGGRRQRRAERAGRETNIHYNIM